MTKKEKAQYEIELAITALLHSSGVFMDRVWMLQLAPPPHHLYHRKEHLDDAVFALSQCVAAMKALTKNLVKVTE